MLKGLGSRLAKKIKTAGSEFNCRDTCNKKKIVRTAAGQRSFHYRTASLWNFLPERHTKLTNIVTFFEKELMRYIISNRLSKQLILLECFYLIHEIGSRIRRTILH